MKITVVVRENPTQLPAPSEMVVPVQIFDTFQRASGVASIGRQALDRISRLGVNVSNIAMDFLTIALAVTAADTFVKRDDAEDGWAREIALDLNLNNPQLWQSKIHQLQEALSFLSGDIWSFSFSANGTKPPTPRKNDGRTKMLDANTLDSVCLFSGGLDSIIGAIDLIHNKRRPMLVSHSYKGDQAKQKNLAAKIGWDAQHCFAVNAAPRSVQGDTDVSMRTRSLNFLAFAVLAADAVRIINQKSGHIDLFVPENGFISINAPLTVRRIGSLSTRTTHPYFIEKIQEIFNSVGIECVIKNPYQLATKGEMVKHCHNQAKLQRVYEATVSCSHWKRANQQCGRCVPCIIRRASLHHNGWQEATGTYVHDNLKLISDPEKLDDVLALLSAISRKKNGKSITTWVSQSGYLSSNKSSFCHVFSSGLEEVEAFLLSQGMKP